MPRAKACSGGGGVDGGGVGGGDGGGIRGGLTAPLPGLLSVMETDYLGELHPGISSSNKSDWVGRWGRRAMG